MGKNLTTTQPSRRSKAFQYSVRSGYVASGLLHLLIGVIALMLAWQAAPSSADQEGALQMLADRPLGTFALWFCMVGFLMLAVWQLTEAEKSDNENSDRLKAAGKFVLYLASAWTALMVSGVIGGGSGGKHLTARIMAWPAGRLLVALIGVAVIGAGVYHVYKGYKRKFLKDLGENPGKTAVLFGRIGYVAKGIAIGVVGILFVVGALHHTSREATGLDGALRALKGQPFGQVLLTIVAIGLMAFGLYSFVRAKYAKV